MSSFPAKPALRRVVVLAYPGVMLLDVAGPVQVFETAAVLVARQGGPRPYAVVAVSAAGGLVPTDTGIAIETAPWVVASPGQAVDTLLVPGGSGAWDAANDSALVDWVTQSSARARRTASVCLGAFILAAAGLLDGRRAATHWLYCAALQSRYPAVRVEPDPIFVRDGAIWSSAGVTAGIDLALAMVEDDCGHAIAAEVARRLVVFLQRPGGQSQFSASLARQVQDGDGRFTRLLSWMTENLTRDLRVERLADQAGMTPRSFARAFTMRTGSTPAKAVEAVRVEAARRLLEHDPHTPIATVALRCGFEDDERMRRAFMRVLGVAPSNYRARFGPGETQPQRD